MHIQCPARCKPPQEKTWSTNWTPATQNAIYSVYVGRHYRGNDGHQPVRLGSLLHVHLYQNDLGASHGYCSDFVVEYLRRGRRKDFV